MHTISQKQATQTHPYIYKKKKRKKEKYFFYRKRRRKRKGGKCRKQPERPVRSSVLATTSGTWKNAVVRIKSRRICCRIPWGLSECCPAFVRKTPGESDTKSGAIRQLNIQSERRGEGVIESYSGINGNYRPIPF